MNRTFSSLLKFRGRLGLLYNQTEPVLRHFLRKTRTQRTMHKASLSCVIPAAVLWLAFSGQIREAAGSNVVAWDVYGIMQTNVPADLTNAVALAAGYKHALALRADGTVVAWGDNGAGQTNVPAEVSNVVAIAAAGFHNLALRADGTI